MSVLCCRIPDFLLNLTLREQARPDDAALVLLGNDARVWAVSPGARAAGVQRAMTLRQARMRCPEVQIHPLDTATSQHQQAGFLQLLAHWELPVEPLEWGAAYIDLQPVSKSRRDAQVLAGELGRTLRREFGAMLQPALGWDSGKFTARAAAACAQPGRIRLVDKRDEVSFLGPLPITLLPLPRTDLQQLHWLGIHTLGQFGALPRAAVGQRFGRAGKLAQLWALGRDDRPVQHGVPAAPAPLCIDLDPPTGLLPSVVAAVSHALAEPLAQARANLRGWRHVRLELHFVDGDAKREELLWLEPVSDPVRLEADISHRLETLIWPSEMSRVEVQVVARSELSMPQLSLFDASLGNSDSGGDQQLQAAAGPLLAKYGSIFFHGQVAEPMHPAAERRAEFLSLP